jgi:hypothetical protein
VPPYGINVLLENEPPLVRLNANLTLYQRFSILVREFFGEPSGLFSLCHCCECIQCYKQEGSFDTVIDVGSQSSRILSFLIKALAVNWSRMPGIPHWID